MTCTTAILRARAHAQTCVEIEECAPPVTAPYLQAAYDRMKLPITIRADHYFNSWRMSGPGTLHLSFRADDATRAYFDLCATLTNSLPAATSSDVAPPLLKELGTADVGAVPASAFSSESATRLLAVTPGGSPPIPPESSGVPDSGAAS